MVQEHGKPRKCTGKPTRACIRSAQRKPICSSSSKLRGSLVRSTKCLLIEAPLYSNAIRKIFLVTNSDYSVRGPNQIGPSSIRYLKFQNVRTSLFSTRGAFRNWDCYRSPTSAICVLTPTALKSFFMSTTCSLVLKSQDRGCTVQYSLHNRMLSNGTSSEVLVTCQERR